MCGRNSLFAPAIVLERRFDARVVLNEYRARYNIAPGSEQPAITNADPHIIQGFTWGFDAP